LDVMSGGAPAAAAAFDSLCAAYEDRRQARPEYPSLERPGFNAFLRRVATEGVADGWGHLSAMLVGPEPLAWHLGFFDRGQLYWWMPAHARAYETLSPGKVLLALMIRRAIDSKWRAIHFLTGAQPYKLAWRPEMPPRRTIRWYAPTLAGTVLRRYDEAAAI
jgi:CelD/BcsL family acetyltransferase involved in cellulose biosynthesis